MTIGTKNEKQAEYILEGEALTISGSLKLVSLMGFLDYCDRAFRNYKRKTVTIMLDTLQEADTGVYPPSTMFGISH